MYKQITPAHIGEWNVKNSLKIANTHSVTCMLKNNIECIRWDKTCMQIDYIPTKVQIRPKTRTFPGADIGSDDDHQAEAENDQKESKHDRIQVRNPPGNVFAC